LIANSTLPWESCKFQRRVIIDD